MNGPVWPAASPDGPASSASAGSAVGSGRRPGAGARLGFALLTPPRALAFFGLSLAGLVLLVAAVGPALLAVDGVWHVLQDVLSHGLGGEDVQDVRNTLVGLACCRFLLPGVLLAMRALASLTRRLTARWCAVAIPEAYAPMPAPAAGGSSGGLRDLILHGHGSITYRQRMTWLLTDRATWKDLLWLAVNAVVGAAALIAPIALAVGGALVAFNVSLHPVGEADLSGLQRAGGALLLVVGLSAAPWLLRAYAGLARLVLAPSEHSVLEQRVAYLALTRQESLDTGAAELRRIERDLHDGAQARLVAMGLTLDAAGRLIDTDPVAARALLIEARDASAKALAELRDLVRGVHPPVLADRGLADAVRALALDSPARARVTGSLGGRAPAPVESAAYFAVSELLANVAKHAAAQSTDIDLRHSLGALRITVRDDGDGGADPGRGTGLRGVERRIAAFDGVLAINSPAGGPTLITMEIPCELS
jgi:signal transduction histidine kinase